MQAPLLELPEEVRPDAFFLWLDQQVPNAPVGMSDRPYLCPAARWLRNVLSHEKGCAIAVRHDFITIYSPTSVHTLSYAVPTWLALFQSFIDESKPSSAPIWSEQARAALQRAIAES
jgi:hypothetical protein